MWAVWRDLLLDDVATCRALIGKSVYCLRVCTDLHQDSTDRGFDRGLALQHCGRDKGDMTFKRIGFMEYYPVDDWLQYAKEMGISIV